MKEVIDEALGDYLKEKRITPVKKREEEMR
jgi:hypothetical protein